MKLLKTVLFVVALASTFAVQAQERTLKFATQNPKGHPLVTGMERFAEIVAAKSGGKIKVNLFPGGVLGSDQANVSAAERHASACSVERVRLDQFESAGASGVTSTRAVPVPVDHTVVRATPNCSMTQALVSRCRVANSVVKRDGLVAKANGSSN